MRLCILSWYACTHTHTHTCTHKSGGVLQSRCYNIVICSTRAVEVQSLVISISFSTGLVPRPHFFYIHSVALRCICMLSHQEFVTVRVCNSPFVYTTATWAVWCRQSVLNMLIRYLTWCSSKHIHCWLVIPIGLLGEVTYIYTSSQITSWQIFRVTLLPSELPPTQFF